MAETPSKIGVKRSRSEEDSIADRSQVIYPPIVNVDEDDETFEKREVVDENRNRSPCVQNGPSIAVMGSEEEKNNFQKVPTPPVDKPKRLGGQTQMRLCIQYPEEELRSKKLGEVSELRSALADKDAKNDELSRRCAMLENELALERSNSSILNERAAKFEGIANQYRQVLTDVMKEAARTQRREARRREHNMHFDLGQILISQNAIGPRELWVEGNRKRELDVEISELSLKIAQIERERKSLLAQQKIFKKRICDSDDVSNSFPAHDPALLDFEEQLQMQQHSLNALASAKQDLEAQIHQLQAEKTAFLKEIRRINDEDASEFSHVQSLHNGRYILLSLLGKGGFSEVWKAFDVESPQYVACKIHRINKDWSQATRDHYLKHAKRELDIMSKLDHPRLTKLFNIFEQDESTFVSVQELSEGTDLDTYLKRYGKMKEPDARIVMMQLVSALRHLAEQSDPIIHYDLKPANIIFHSAFPSCLDIKVTDFGLSKVVKERGNSMDPTIELTSQGTGTYWYLPPECFETNGLTPPKISNKVDIWAAGVIFYQLLYGKRPFAEGESQKRIWQDKLILGAKSVSFPPEPKVPESAKEVIQLCLKYNASERPDIIQLSKLPYFKPKAKGTSSGTQASKMLPPTAPVVPVAPPPIVVQAAPLQQGPTQHVNLSPEQQ